MTPEVDGQSFPYDSVYLTMLHPKFAQGDYSGDGGPNTFVIVGKEVTDLPSIANLCSTIISIQPQATTLNGFTYDLCRTHTGDAFYAALRNDLREGVNIPVVLGTEPQNHAPQEDYMDEGLSDNLALGDSLRASLEKTSIHRTVAGITKEWKSSDVDVDTDVAREYIEGRDRVSLPRDVYEDAIRVFTAMMREAR